ncbi:MAG TPA: DUF1810 domain-containing protein [Thermoanaerobaculia bacterium]|nr:DUF1810 domain-containing protein [Thermoanaerobaculia bacterium]
MNEDRFNLERFVEAQQEVYENVRSELRAGRKQSHWMWFIFPQIRGLGHSYTSQIYAVSGLDEAVAFLDHPILGRRLRECTALANAVRSSSAREVFGRPDDLKFHSSMTLFAHAASDKTVFLQALEKYFGSAFDPLTLQRL